MQKIPVVDPCNKKFWHVATWRRGEGRVEKGESCVKVGGYRFGDMLRRGPRQDIP